MLNSEAAVEDSWKILSNAINDILSGNDEDIQIATCKEACNNLVEQGKADEIHTELHNNLSNQFKKWHEQLSNVDENSFLSTISHQYDIFKKYCSIFPTIYTSYDNSFNSEPNKTLNCIRKLFVDNLLSDKHFYEESVTPITLNFISKAQTETQDENEFSQLSNIIQMYESFSDCHSIDITTLYTKCLQFIKDKMLEKGQKLTDDDKSSTINKPELIGDLITLTVALSKRYKLIFKGKDAIHRLDSCIEKTWNNFDFNICQNFNDYINELILNKFKDVDSDELMTIIPQFYQYIDNKPLFNTYYERLFVHRLILQTDEQNEELVINAIRKVSPEFMENYERYKSNYDNSKQIKDDFINEKPEFVNDIVFEPLIVDDIIYPFKKEECNFIPENVYHLYNSFKFFYSSKLPKKKLELMYHGSLIDITIKFPQIKKTYRFRMDLLCGHLILNLIRKPLKFSEIIGLFDNNRTIALKIVAPLITKFKLLVINPRTTKLEGNSLLMINERFQYPKHKVYIPPIIQDQIPFSFLKAEREAIQQAIIDVLGNQRQMKLNDLIHDVIYGLHEKFEVNREKILLEIDAMHDSIEKETNGDEVIVRFIG